MFCLQLLSLSCTSEHNRLQIIAEAGSHGLMDIHQLDQQTFQFTVADSWQEVAGTVMRHVGHGFDSCLATDSCLVISWSSNLPANWGCA